MKTTPQYSFNKCFAKHRAIVRNYKKKKKKYLSITFGYALKKQLLKLGIQWLTKYTSIEIDGNHDTDYYIDWNKKKYFYTRPYPDITLTINYQGLYPNNNYLKFIVKSYTTCTQKTRLKPRNIQIYDHTNKQTIDIFEAYLDTYNCTI